ncbi:hypothetical protein KEM52_003810, partial [Ascosphaera acerosa]
MAGSEDAEKFLDGAGWGLAGDSHNVEADRVIVEAILNFSRLLMERCGNRSLYSSSERVNDLLNTTSLSLLQTTLRLGFHLAQRYYLRQRVCNSQSPFHQSLLLAHYNIDLDRVQRVTMPVPRPPAAPGVASAVGAGGHAEKGSAKGKSPAAQSKNSSAKINPNDIVCLFGSECEDADNWAEWGGLHMTYFHMGANASAASSHADAQAQVTSPTTANMRTIPFFDHESQMPTTPSPLSRSVQRPTRATTGDRTAATAGGPSSAFNSRHTARAANAPAVATPSAQRTTAHPATTPAADSAATSAPTPGSARTGAAPDQTRGTRVLQLSADEIRTTDTTALMKRYLPQLPADSQYEFMHRLRMAKAMTSSDPAERRRLHAIRVLAVTNLAYV